MTDSANTPVIDDADQAPAGLDSLLVSVLSGEVGQPKKRGRFKGACNGQGISLGILNFGLKTKQWLISWSSGRDVIDIRNAVSE